jgi:tetratricopeptide (TPR) repeat protein
MLERSDRDTYFQEFAGALAVPRYDDPRRDIWSLVTACLSRSGVLDKLVERLEFSYPGSDWVPEFKRLATQIESHAGEASRQETSSDLAVGTSHLEFTGRAEPMVFTELTLAERGSLADLIVELLAEGLSIQQVISDASIVSYFPERHGLNWTDPPSVVDHVSNASEVERNPEILLGFAEALAHSGGTVALGHRIHAWVERVGYRMGYSQQDLEDLCRRSTRPIAPDIPESDIPEADDAARAPDPAEQVVDPSGSTQTDTTTPIYPEHLGDDEMRIIVQTPATMPTPKELTPIWGGVPIRNPHFTGREQLMQRLRYELTRHGKTSVLPQAVHGLGGVGKTQLATEYVYRYTNDYNLVWWITAERTTAVLTSLSELGRLLNVSASDDMQQTARRVLDKLGKSGYRWLLVYDNAEHPEEIGGLVPSAGGHVILTSRNPDWTKRWTTIEVDVFEREESIELLLQLLKHRVDVPRDTADLLAEKLGDLPLALEQAANFQLATGMSFDEYLELFDQRVGELLSEGKPADYSATVPALFTMAFARLREASPAAAELFELFAHLGPEPISAGLLQKGRTAEVSTELSKALRDPIQLRRMIRDVPKYGLARLEPKGPRLQVHRLVQAVLRDRLAEEDRTRSLTNVRNLLGVVNPSRPDAEDTWNDHAELGPHVMPADLIHAENPDARLVAIDQARYLFNIGDYRGSRRLGEAMVAEWSKSPDAGGLGPDHEQTLLACRHLANALKMFGEYDESLRLDQQTFQALRENPAFGDDHEHTVALAFGLGFDLRMAGDGDLVGSLESDRENLARATRVYGPQGDETVRATTNLAAGLRAAGRFQEAYELSSRVVAARRETLGDNSRWTVWSVSERVRDLFGLGQYQEALQAQQRVASTFQHLFRPHERERLLAERNLVILLRKTGDHGAALVRARENHEAFKTHFGSDHEYTLAARMGQANALRATGRLAEARSTGAEALGGYRRKFGPRHWLTLAAQVNQGIILRLLREREAGELERATFHALTATVGEEHPFTLCAAVNYASSLSLGHEVVAARELTERTLEISQRVRGEDHPDTLACALNAALDEQASGEDPAGQQRLDSVMDAFQRVLGADHPDTIDAIRGKRADCDLEPPPT